MFPIFKIFSTYFKTKKKKASLNSKDIKDYYKTNIENSSSKKNKKYIDPANLFDFKKLEGLSSTKAELLLKKYGENSIISQKNVSAVKIFAGQFKDFLALILLIAAIVSIFMGEVIEAISISIILFLNAIMGFIQEYKTEKTLEALDKMVTQTAKVVREGKIFSIPATNIVKGDLIFVKSGDSVPADAVILDSKKLKLDESILTGETQAVEKSKYYPSDDIGIDDIDNKNIIYMGTAVVDGEGFARVVATANETQMGKIASLIENIKEEPTPLQKKLAQMGRFIIAGCLTVSLIVIVFGILRGEEVFYMLITGLSLAVASVPEGLPAIVTIALAFSIKHMVRRKALIRKLHAVETLGCANVICTDKTGTITENKITVKKIATFNFDFDVRGEGLKKEGAILQNGRNVNFNSYPFLKDILEVGVICNSSDIFSSGYDSSCWDYIGEPTEAALLVAAARAGLVKKKLDYKIFDEIPFDSYRKFMASFVQNSAGKKFIFVKGAYDVVSNMCGYYKDYSIYSFEKVKDVFDIKHEKMSKAGMRVIAVAYKEFDGESFNDDLNSLTFLGLFEMLDMPRREAKTSVRVCKNAGIRTIMITGDHKNTAISVAKQVGIYKKEDLCFEGKEIDNMSDYELREVLKDATVFARVTPSHKLRIVRELKKSGNVVAMTGDGVNDAPAVKEADIGVSMGTFASEVTKQAADLVLLDDNFSTLVAAVEEGRTIYGNIRKFMRYLLSCNIGEVLTSLFAILFGMPIPLLPMQILIINLVTDSLPAMALGLEPKEKYVMNRPPRDVKESIFSNGLLFTILFRGFLIALTTLTVFTIIFRMTLSIDLSRTAAFLTLVSLQLIHVFECKSETKSIFKINHLNNKKLLFCVTISFTVAIGSVWVRPFNRILKNFPLNFQQTAVVIFFTLLVPLINAVILYVKDYIHKKDEYEDAYDLPLNL